MKITIVVLLAFFQFSALSQTFLTPPPDSLIRKYRIKKITVRAVDSSKTVNPNWRNINIWEFNSSGNLIREEIWIGPQINHYYYEDGLLKRQTHSWNYQNNDTTIYSYNQDKRLLETVYLKYENSSVSLRYNCRYEYPNQNMVILKKEDISYSNTPPESKLSCDTLLYNKDKLPVMETWAKHGLRTYYYYNRRRQLVRKIETNKTPNFYRKYQFIYKKGRLIREVKVYYENAKKIRATKKVSDYLYDDRGLLIFIRPPYLYDHGKVGNPNFKSRNYYIFNYEYY